MYGSDHPFKILDPIRIKKLLEYINLTEENSQLICGKMQKL
jgi:hypothetical protein